MTGKWSRKTSESTLTAVCVWSQGRSCRSFLLLSYSVIYVQSSLLPPVLQLSMSVCFFGRVLISFPINSFLLKDNNQDKANAGFPTNATHTVRVTICLHCGGLSEFLEGVGPGDGKAPIKFIVVHKYVGAILAMWQKCRAWRKMKSNTEVKWRPWFERKRLTRVQLGFCMLRKPILSRL